MRAPVAFRGWLPVLLAALVVLAGCSKKSDTTAQNPPPATSDMPAGLHVMSVTLGRTLNPDKKIGEATEQFAPTETVYASVETMGSAPSATLAARWTFEDGQLVDETSQTIAPDGPAVTEFHVSKPSGWPPGTYKVEIMLDGRTAATKSFTVRA
jgi:hypothetical protein